MKRMVTLMLVLLMLTGCSSKTIAEVTEAPSVPVVTISSPPAETNPPAEPDRFVSQFDTQTTIALSDSGVTVEGNTEAVYTSNDIIYYEDKDTYESGNPYGEGTDADKHSAEEAAAHTVVNITQPGAYTVTGTLSAGQIRVDLGKDAYDDPSAVVELNLDSANITCTVAPAILFLNTYECDGNWSADEAKPDVDTSAAGANLILIGENNISGAYVAKVFKDSDGEKKLWKQDGAIYSYMSMNVWGSGILNLTPANEGLDTELHLTIQGGNINICSDNDGINTNEDNVSVTTINGGNVRIVAGLGKEGDGIDSNGYLVINGGTVIASANPKADAGLDSDLGSFIHGGTVIALGSAMDWAESDSGQVTMNLQFAEYQDGSSAIVVTNENDAPVFTFDPAEDPVLKDHLRQYRGVILSGSGLQQGQTCHLFVDGVQMQYTGTEMRGGPGRGNRGQRPDREMPADFTLPEGETMPEGFEPGQLGDRSPESDSEDRQPPEGFDGERPTLPEGETRPEGERPSRGGRGDRQEASEEPSTDFYLEDKVNAFSGITATAA